VVNAKFLVLLNVMAKIILKRLLFQMSIIVTGGTDRSPFIEYLPLEYINRKNLSFSVLETPKCLIVIFNKNITEHNRPQHQVAFMVNDTFLVY
jgi:hypothetical protein